MLSHDALVSIAIFVLTGLGGLIAMSLRAAFNFIRNLENEVKSQKNRIGRLESLSCSTLEDTNKELDQRLELLENRFAHSDEIISSKIKTEADTTKLKMGFLFANLQSTKSDVAEIKQHLVGLQMGLTRNNIPVRVEEAWLQEAVNETRLSDLDGASMFD